MEEEGGGGGVQRVETEGSGVGEARGGRGATS